MNIYVTYDETGRAYYFKGIIGKWIAYIIGLKHHSFLDRYENNNYYLIKDFRSRC